MTAIELAAIGVGIATALTVAASFVSPTVPSESNGSPEHGLSNERPDERNGKPSLALGDQLRVLLGPGMLGLVLLPITLLFAAQNASLLAEGFSALLGKNPEPVLDLVVGGRAITITDCYVMGSGLTLAVVLIGAAIADAHARNAPATALIATATGLLLLDAVLAAIRGFEAHGEVDAEGMLVVGTNVLMAVLYATTELVCGKFVIHDLLLAAIRAVLLAVAAPLRELARALVRLNGPFLLSVVNDAFRRALGPLASLDIVVGPRVLAGIALAIFLLMIASGCNSTDLRIAQNPRQVELSILFDNTAGTSREDYSRYPQLAAPVIASLAAGDCVSIIALVENQSPLHACLEGRKKAVAQQKNALIAYLGTIALSTDKRGVSDIGALFAHVVTALGLHARLRPGRRAQNLVLIATDGVETGRQTAPAATSLPTSDPVNVVVIGVRKERIGSLKRMASAFRFDPNLTEVIGLEHADEMAAYLPTLIGRAPAPAPDGRLQPAALHP